MQPNQEISRSLKRRPGHFYPTLFSSKGIKETLFPNFCCFFFFCSTRIWTQGLHLEPLHQPFFAMFFSWDRVLQTICPGWLWAMILLMSVSWVAGITGVSLRHLALFAAFMVFPGCSQPEARNKAWLSQPKAYTLQLLPTHFIRQGFCKRRGSKKETTNGCLGIAMAWISVL
jgi:hypothetical protein